jgi:hypothetical protein
MKGIVVVIIAAVLTICARAETAPVLRVDFSNPGLTPSQWTLEFHPDGSGHFHSVRGTAVTEGVTSFEAPDIDREIQLSPRFADHAFQVTRRHKLFAKACESHLKVAFQGTKKLSYSGPDGEGSCEYNYSKDSEIQSLGDSLIAVATTIIEGARLEMLLQHDRLGLDREIGVIEESLGDGRVQQISSIRDILERLADDPAVMERVRKRARDLLSKAND